ncbi:MAG: L,D-transpeptidase family protein [Mogibacterium sp.]|nr:L,D-transpeptidase family protein [Mogibacterium sp.]MBR4089662.1 L,D-transpeptidase family protein [Mogibacterium sp.]
MKNTENSTKRGPSFRPKRYASMLLAMLLCLAMLPAWTFAEDEIPAAGQEQATATEVQEDIVMSVDEEAVEVQPVEEEAAEAQPVEEETVEALPALDAEAAEEEPAPAATSRTVKPAKTAFEWDGGGAATYKFKTPVVLVEPANAAAAPDNVWIKAAKKNIKVSWNSAKADVDGYIILRKAAKETVYSELATAGKGATSYTDKKAKKKNTPYYYRVVGFKNVAEGRQISPSINWAAGQTSNSKLKSKYEATLSKNTVKVQVGERYNLALSYKSTKNVFLPAKFQWVSDDKSVATINPTTGNGIARGIGTTKLHGFIASGTKYDATITVVGAIKPAAPKVELIESDVDRIGIKWKAVNYATSYDVYCKAEGSDGFELLTNTEECKYYHTGLEENQHYTYFVIAHNDNDGSPEVVSEVVYSETSDKSNELTQAAEFFQIPFSKPVFTNSTPKLKYGAKDNGVQMSWKQEVEAGVERYEILRGTSKDVASMKVVATADPESKSYDYLEETAGTYYYAVRAVGFNGKTEVSEASGPIKVVASAILKTHGLTWTSTTKVATDVYGSISQSSNGKKVTGHGAKVGHIAKGVKVTCIGKGPSEIAKFHKPTWVKVQAPDGTVGWLPYKNLKGGVKAVINLKNDYTRSVKENFVNTMGYTSDTNYLCWLCTYTQRVYTFKGSKGKWVLQRTDRVTTGMFSHPTPGIDEKHRSASKGRIYKKDGRVNMVTEQGRKYYYKYASYFSPGISFHTGTWWSDTGKRRGSVASKPNTYGCIRMYDKAAKWVYDHIPKQSSVVVTNNY